MTAAEEKLRRALIGGIPEQNDMVVLLVDRDGDINDPVNHVTRGDLRDLLAQRQWRAIESAPITEDVPEAIKYVLVWNGHHRGVGYRWKSDYADDPEWFDEGGHTIDPAPTHWMPLPEPPK